MSEIQRGEIWWASLPPPAGSGPGYRRPVLVVQDNDFNDSEIRTVVIVVITSNLELSSAPGNVVLRRQETGLPRKSVVNVSQVWTVDKSFLTDRVGVIPPNVLNQVAEGLRLILAL